MVSPVHSSSSGSSEDSSSVVHEEVSETAFWDIAADAPIAVTDEYESTTVKVGVVSFEIGDCITLFGVSHELDLSFAFHINGLMDKSLAEQETMVTEMFEQQLARLDEEGGYRAVKFDLFLVGGTKDAHSQQLGAAMIKVMGQFFDAECCEIDNSLLFPDKGDCDFITAYLSREGKIYFFFHDEK